MTLPAALAPLPLSEIEPSRKRSLPPTTEGPPKRSKKGKKSKGSSKAVIPELNPSDYVRVVKVTNKDDLLHEGPVLLSKSDKASQMHLSDNRMSVTSSKGYRMVRFLQSLPRKANVALSPLRQTRGIDCSTGSCYTWCFPRHMVL